ncbi:MAG: alpha-amylase family glycosyl hydrolase [Nostoc sp.]|uniref:alpha-amylase family glycosyl hydrolase n=1 Tax=Nostoc sp. TaxID=1180 RepID=UPI002FF72D94
MPRSIKNPEVQWELDRVRQLIPGKQVTPSPIDWRDHWIYLLMVDRFNNPVMFPKVPYNENFGGFQGGTIQGIQEQLDYLKSLGVGAIWLTPVLKNCQFLDDAPSEGTYHGYGIQNFLEIDPRFNSNSGEDVNQVLQDFIQEAHSRNIYIIFDIVLNHTGDVFAYPSGSEANYSDTPYPVRWRDEKGNARSDWKSEEDIHNPDPDAVVFPDELQRNAFFRRQGKAKPGGAETIGDFGSLKQLLTSNYELGNVLIYCFQYIMALYDIDGFRIDTLKFLDPNFALRFGNAIREFALSMGKKNFFTFGEVYDGEQKIAQFIGRNVSSSGDLVGIDAALDYPLFFKLPNVLKGLSPPSDVVNMYQQRKDIERNIISSHGEATRFFVTFLDNHDQRKRFYYSSESNPHQFDDQATMGFACLFCLPGIPCLYYGTEQGLHGNQFNDSDQSIREALWGKPNPFDVNHPFYTTIQQISKLRNEQPTLRYGRFYFRQISGDGLNFGISPYPSGVLAFSRILNDQEVVVVANTSTSLQFAGFVIIDSDINSDGEIFKVLFSNKSNAIEPEVVQTKGPGLTINEVEGGTSIGPVRVLRVVVKPMEVQILGRPIGG